MRINIYKKHDRILSLSHIIIIVVNLRDMSHKLSLSKIKYY